MADPLQWSLSYGRHVADGLRSVRRWKQPRSDRVDEGIGRPRSNAFGSSLFRRYFVAESASLVGGQITLFALPTLAILLAGADAFEVGLVYALGYIPSIVIGIPVGVAVDRFDRRRLMVFADLLRFIATSSIAVAWFTNGTVAILHVYVVAFVIGLGTTIYDVAAQAALPLIVSPDAVGDANAKLALGRSLSQLIGAPITGALIQSMGAALSMFLDALACLASAALLVSASNWPSGVGSTHGRSRGEHAWSAAVSVISKNGPLRRVLALMAVLNLGGAMIGALFLVYAYEDLHLPASIVGLALGLGSLGALVASLSAVRIQRLVGLEPVMRLSAIAAGGVLWMIPAASIGFAAFVLAAYEFLFSGCATLFVICQLTWRQTTIPNELQGRVNAIVRMVAIGALPLGALLGGICGSAFGITNAILLGATVASVGGVILGVSWRTQSAHNDMAGLGR